MWEELQQTGRQLNSEEEDNDDARVCRQSQQDEAGRRWEIDEMERERKWCKW